MGLERVVGSLSDPASYKGFDIVISAVGDDLCAKQPEFIDAAFAAGVKHFVPGECEFYFSFVVGGSRGNTAEGRDNDCLFLVFIVGSDMAHPKSRDEAYFQDKIATRRHLEKRIKEDPSLGYTYVMVCSLSSTCRCSD